MPLQNKQLRVLACCLAVLAAPQLPAQETSPAETSPPPAAPPAPKPKQPASAAQMLAQMQEEETRAKARIKEIESIVFPIQDEIAQKQFFFNKGEFAFLRMQTESGKTSAKFFEAQSRIDQDSWAGVAEAFDIAYEAMREGKLWVGREQSLISEDAALFADLNAKVLAAIRERPDGAKIMDMIEERDRLMNQSRASGPMLKYLSERRLWWTAYPEYMQAVQQKTPPAR